MLPIYINYLTLLKHLNGGNLEERAVTVLVKFLKGDNDKEIIRKLIPYPLNDGDTGTILHYTSVKEFVQIIDKAKKYDKLKEILQEMLE